MFAVRSRLFRAHFRRAHSFVVCSFEAFPPGMFLEVVARRHAELPLEEAFGVVRGGEPRGIGRLGDAAARLHERHRLLEPQVVDILGRRHTHLALELEVQLCAADANFGRTLFDRELLFGEVLFDDSVDAAQELRVEVVARDLSGLYLSGHVAAYELLARMNQVVHLLAQGRGVEGLFDIEVGAHVVVLHLRIVARLGREQDDLDVRGGDVLLDALHDS